MALDENDIAKITELTTAAIVAAQAEADKKTTKIVNAAIAQLHFFVRGQHPIAGGDEHGAIGRGLPQTHLPCRLEQLRRHQHIQSPRQRIQAKHRATIAQLGLTLRENFQVIRGRARALRHAWNGCGLRRVAGVTRSLDQPIGQDATALAAQSAQQN